MMLVEVVRKDENCLDATLPDFIIYKGKIYRKQGIIGDFLMKICYFIKKRFKKK